METYEGIKFAFSRIGEVFDIDERLFALGRWVYLFAELGLAPVHAEGAYGNHSFRVTEDSFLITRTGMRPRAKMEVEDYCLVENYDEKRGVFDIRGKSEPSSESFLHLFIYRAYPNVKTIMHGHSQLLNQYATTLGIPVTLKKDPYGTMELAQSALDVLDSTTPFIILKDHGFVAVGDDIDITGNLVLTKYAELLELLRR